MHSIAPSPWAFMRSRARSRRYFRMRSQLTRCCQSRPAIPKLAPICALAPEREVDGRSENEEKNMEALIESRTRARDDLFFARSARSAIPRTRFRLLTRVPGLG